MSKEKDSVLEGLITRMIDRIGRKVAAKDPKIARLKKKLDVIEKELDAIIDKDYGGKPPSWMDAARKVG